MDQLALKTEFNFGRTYGKVDDVVAAAKQAGARRLAITDPNTYGHVAFYEACKRHEVDAIFGVELRLRVKPDDEVSRPILLYAVNQEGLSELYRMSTQACELGALDYEHLTLLTRNVAVGLCSWLDPVLIKRIIGVKFCNVSPANATHRREAVAFAKKHKLMVIPTSDNSYPRVGDRRLSEVIGSALRTTPQHIINRGEAQLSMPELKKADYQNLDTVGNMLVGVNPVRAENIKFKFDLLAACKKGIKDRKLKWTKEYQARLDHEIKTITEKGFVDYFAVISDMVMYAKQHMLVGPARGSAAGSLVCYLIHITDIDPIEHDLMFERFIDETRFDFPDIDMDFPDSKRHMVMEYLAERHGAENVAQIGTVNRLKAKSALNLVAKKYDIPPWDMTALRESMIERSGGDARAAFCLADTFELEAGKALLEKYPQALDSTYIEAHASHSGVHAAGVIICNRPVSNYATINKERIAQIDKYDAEKVNLMKIDCLGLRTLSVIESTGIDVRGIPLDNQAAFDVVNNRRFAGVFQFEGIALQLLTRQIGVKTFEDIVAITSLARPGPLHAGAHIQFTDRRFGRAPIEKVHPIFDKITEKTLGMVLYQEQVMAILRQVGQMEWADVQILRRAMSKSYGLEFFEKFYDRFAAGAKRVGMKADDVRKMWELMIHFGSYGFNRSHAVAYAIISYWCMYLKANHPVEFALACLQHASDDEQARKVLREIVSEGDIEFIPFDKDHSQISWSMHNGKLLGGLTSIKGIGPTTAAKIVAEREEGRLSPSSIKKLTDPELVFGDLFPAARRFGKYYTNPEAMGLREGTVVTHNKDLTDQSNGEFVIIGRLIEKNLRDLNETASLSKRGGKRINGQSTFLHLKLEDDTDLMMATVGRFDMRTLGKQFIDAPLDSWWLLRGEIKKGFRRMYVKKAKRIDQDA